LSRILRKFLYIFTSGGPVPDTISDARANLTSHVARFRVEGLDAEPVVFGDHRQPEAVLLPYATFELLLDVAEDIAIAERVRERLAADNRSRRSLAEVASDLGVDLDDEAGEGDLAYLLAGLRLARLTDPVRRSDAQRRVDRIRRLLEP